MKTDLSKLPQKLEAAFPLLRSNISTEHDETGNAIGIVIQLVHISDGSVYFYCVDNKSVDRDKFPYDYIIQGIAFRLAKVKK